MTSFTSEQNVLQEPTVEMANAATEETIYEEQEVSKQVAVGAQPIIGAQHFFKANTTKLFAKTQGNILTKQKGQYTRYIIGGKGGNSFEAARYRNGIVVSGIEAWAGEWQLRGIRITFSDQSKVTYGKTEGKYCGSLNIDYLSAETITELSVWGNGAGTRCGSFRIKTSKGQTFHPQMTKWGLKSEYKMNVGSGIMMGVTGRAGDDIDSLGFLMLDKVKKSVLTQFDYDLNKVPLPQQKYAYDITIPNPSNSDSDKGVITTEVTKQKGGEWFIKAGFTFGQEYSVQGGVPEIAEVRAKTSWKVSVEGGYNHKWSTTDKQTVSIPLIAPALSKTRIVYSYFQGKVDACPFEASMRYYLDGGGIWDCHVSGFYDGVDTTRVVGTTSQIARWDGETRKWIDEDNSPTLLL